MESCFETLEIFFDSYELLVLIPGHVHVRE